MNHPSAADLRQFLDDNNVPLIMTMMVEDLCVTQPRDCVAHMIQWLQDYRTKEHPPALAEETPRPLTRDELQLSMHTEDDDEALVKLVRASSLKMARPSRWDGPNHEGDGNRRRFSFVERRQGVSSETATTPKTPNLPVKPRAPSPATRRRIETCLMSNILFRALSEDALQVIYNAMFERTVEAGTFIMRQYDEGDNFYVIESGTCHILIQASPTAEPVLQTTIGPGASFGELALMYGTPRAASVQAITLVKLWVLDRDTFRRILLSQTLRKRRQYEGFLAQVPLFETLTSYERLTMADALQPCSFSDKEVVVRQGGDGGAFYIIIEGQVRVEQTINGRAHTLNVLGPRDFFGEMSLMFGQPCVATVISEGETHCVSLERDSFTALLGPLEDILQRNIETYGAPHGREAPD